MDDPNKADDAQETSSARTGRKHHKLCEAGSTALPSCKTPATVESYSNQGLHLVSNNSIPVEKACKSINAAKMKSPGTATFRSAGEESNRTRGTGDNVSLPREPDAAGLAVPKTNAAIPANMERDLKDSNAGAQKKNEKALLNVTRDYAGNVSQPGAYAVQETGKTANLSPQSEIPFDATPTAASGMLASKTAIANLGSTLRSATSPGAISVEEALPPQGESGGGATLVGASGMLASKTAIANRGDTLRPANAPGVVSVEEKSTLTEASSSFLTSKEAIANRSTGVRAINRGNETAVLGMSLQDDPGEMFKLNSEKSDTLLSLTSVAIGEDPEYFCPPSLIHDVSTGTVPLPSPTSTTSAVPMAEMVMTDLPMDDIERQALFKQAKLAAEIDVRQQIIGAAVAAEVVDEAEMKGEQRRRQRFRYTCLAFIVIVVALIAGLVGGLVGGDTKSPPPMSAFPSAAPTETPNNDFCEEALVVTGDDSIFIESLVNTTIEIETRLSCSTGDEIQEPHGRWYEYTGNGLRLTVSLRSAPVDQTQVEIFTGASCGKLVCAETDRLQTMDLSFPTNVNVIYHILVFSTLNAASDLNDPYTLRVFDNSACGNAHLIDFGSGGSLQLGSTAAATVRDIAPPCGSATSSASPGVWYTVVGSGLNIEASTCSGAAFDTQISVYTGSCGNLICVTGNNDSCGTQSSVLWLSSVDLTYYIFVHGASASATGSFELSFMERPVNDSCEGATTLDPLLGGQYSSVDSTTPSTVQGSTIGASFDDVPACGDLSNTASGVWYTVIGSGGRMRVFLDESGEGAGFNARVSVFRGNCNSLECVDRDDSLHWNSTAGELYFIYVYGVDGSAGNFGLFVDLGNAFCSDVVNPLPSDGTVFDGSFNELWSNASTINGLPVCELYPFEPSTGLTVWYSVVGTGTTMLVSSCVLFPSFSLTVYTGDCDNLTCIPELNQGTNFGGVGNAVCARYVSWASVKDQLYYIRAETMTRTGLVKYSIRVTEESPQ